MKKMFVIAVLFSIIGIISIFSIGKNKTNLNIDNVVQQPPPITTDRILADLYNISPTQSRILGMVIDDAATLENIPSEYLVAIIKVESDFQWKAKSSEGAVGLAQIKPEYWDQVKGYNVYDKYENVYLSAFILKEYQQQLGHWDAALRAYNVGITNYRNNNSQSAQQRYIVKITIELNKIQQYKAKQQLSEELVVGI